MPIALPEAETLWEGPLARTTGTLSSGSGAPKRLALTGASRTEQPAGKTSPEELIAAAHATCFAIALVLGENHTPSERLTPALALSENHTPSERLTVSAACTLDDIGGAPGITTVALTVGAQRPGLERADFGKPARNKVFYRGGFRPESQQSEFIERASDAVGKRIECGGGGASTCRVPRSRPSWPSLRMAAAGPNAPALGGELIPRRARIREGACSVLTPCRLSLSAHVSQVGHERGSQRSEVS